MQESDSGIASFETQVIEMRMDNTELKQMLINLIECYCNNSAEGGVDSKCRQAFDELISLQSFCEASECSCGLKKELTRKAHFVKGSKLTSLALNCLLLRIVELEGTKLLDMSKQIEYQEVEIKHEKIEPPESLEGLWQ